MSVGGGVIDGAAYPSATVGIATGWLYTPPLALEPERTDPTGGPPGTTGE
jgi:hypothetical protein